MIISDKQMISRALLVLISSGIHYRYKFYCFAWTKYFITAD